MLGNNTMRQFLTITKALADEQRVRILMVLQDETALCWQTYRLAQIASLNCFLLTGRLASCGFAGMPLKWGRRHYYQMPKRSEMVLIQHTINWFTDLRQLIRESISNPVR